MPTRYAAMGNQTSLATKPEPGTTLGSLALHTVSSQRRSTLPYIAGTLCTLRIGRLDASSMRYNASLIFEPVDPAAMASDNQRCHARESHHSSLAPVKGDYR